MRTGSGATRARFFLRTSRNRSIGPFFYPRPPQNTNLPAGGLNPLRSAPQAPCATQARKQSAAALRSLEAPGATPRRSAGGSADEAQPRIPRKPRGFPACCAVGSGGGTLWAMPPPPTPPDPPQDDDLPSNAFLASLPWYVVLGRERHPESSGPGYLVL